MEKDTKPVGVEFFITELEQITRVEEKRYANLSRRIAALEQDRQPSSFEDDPTKMIIGMVVLMAVLQIAMPFLQMWAEKKCQS